MREAEVNAELCDGCQDCIEICRYDGSQFDIWVIRYSSKFANVIYGYDLRLVF